MPTASNLAKKTKNEILEEYEKLREQIEDAKSIAKTAHSQTSLDLVARAKNFNRELADQSAIKLKDEIGRSWENFSNNLGETLKNLIDGIEMEIKKFEELQSAIAVSKNVLENQYHLQVAAEALDNLISDYDNKKKQAEEEYRQQQIALVNKTIEQKLAWVREQEEYDYNFKLKRQREKDLVEEESAKREREWRERELLLEEKEAEGERIKEQSEKIPQIVENQTTERVKVIAKNLEIEYQNKLAREQKDWLGKEQIYKLKIENLEEQIKKQEVDIVVLKKEQESASKKAQEMAIKIIESGANIIKVSDDQIKPGISQ